MEQQSRSGLRELQIAQGLVALRWASIPILFGFSLLATKFLGMSFQFTPIYFLSCLLAILNVYFTVHIAMLSRQLVLRKGHASLRRFLNQVISKFLLDIRTSGIKAFTGIISVFLKIASTIYLMILVSLRGVRFNILSLENVMHSQVIVDILIITLFVRYTGSPESPLMILAVIPIIVAGAVMGFYMGGIYSIFAGATYLLLCLLVNFKMITHIKFYGPQYGDLSLSLGWGVASFIVIVVALLGTAYLAHNLTAVFKERIFFLNQLLEKNRRESTAQATIAENIGIAWFILDSNGVILKFKRGRLGLIPECLLGENILDAVPAFRQYGMAYVLQSVITGGRSREIERIKLQANEGTTHTLSCRLMPIMDSDQHSIVLLLVEDMTDLLYFKERFDETKQTLDSLRNELEKVSLDSKEANQQLMKTLKLANERSIEIQTLGQKLKGIEERKAHLESEISNTVKEMAGIKSSNDTLRADLTYKEMILEEVTELLKNCNQLDTLTAMIERRTKSLFKLDNACLHIFSNRALPSRMTEILDTRKASPRLLDLPRKNPKVLDPVLNDGQPVIIKAEVHPEKGASMAISNGPLHRLVAYIPIRHGNEILGMMMLDRYDSEEKPEKMLEMLTYYLSHTAVALKNAITTRDLETQRESLSSTIKALDSHIEGLKGLIRFSPATGDKPYQEFVKTLSRICGAIDAMIVRIHNDGAVQTLARMDLSKGPDLKSIEEQVLKTLQANPAHKAIVKETSEGTVLYGYPLSQGSRLCGVLFIQTPETDHPPTGIADMAAKLAAEQLSLMVLGEEKELWENFYKENLIA